MKKPLWSPSKDRRLQSNMWRFTEFVNKEHALELDGYQELYRWSIDNTPEFWEAVWRFTGVKASSPYTRIVDNFEQMQETKWFPDAKLNFAENLLRYRDDRYAFVFKREGSDPVITMTYQEVYAEVAQVAAALRQAGVQVGDRVGGYLPNIPETVVAMLATASIGAIWSSCSPDFGARGALDRFGQIEPKVLFITEGYFYNGKNFSSLEKAKEIVEQLPSLKQVVVIEYGGAGGDIAQIPKAIFYPNFKLKEQEVVFEQLPFDHPLYIMYSSGTTGIPKAIVHGAGGTLLQHLKELELHTDLKRDDVIFYYTTCGWMMWNWLVSSLAVGATVVLFDGSPFYPDAGALCQLAEDIGITVFGTSPKFLEGVQKAGFVPKEKYNLSRLRTILSTGSPLSTGSFDFVYEQFKEDLQLASISGGTDIISCFALGNPFDPVYAGELQGPGLGMKVESYDSEGKPVIGQKGDLVCTKAFPSMPIYFWKDPNGAKYTKSYFNVYPNIWHHGDYIEITERGGVIIYGRSDATLNPGGVRIGTAEIYRQVESLSEILDSLVVGQDWNNDVRVVLFVKLREGIVLDDALKAKIKQTIRANTTPRHVPAKILAVPEIPYTINGKKVELAVRNLIHQQPVLNKESLANPQALSHFNNLSELAED